MSLKVDGYTLQEGDLWQTFYKNYLKAEFDADKTDIGNFNKNKGGSDNFYDDDDPIIISSISLNKDRFTVNHGAFNNNTADDDDEEIITDHLTSNLNMLGIFDTDNKENNKDVLKDTLEVGDFNETKDYTMKLSPNSRSLKQSQITNNFFSPMKENDDEGNGDNNDYKYNNPYEIFQSSIQNNIGSGDNCNPYASYQTQSKSMAQSTLKPESTADPYASYQQQQPKVDTADPYASYQQTADPYASYQQTTNPYASFQQHVADPYANYQQNVADPYASYQQQQPKVDTADDQENLDDANKKSTDSNDEDMLEQFLSTQELGQNKKNDGLGSGDSKEKPDDENTGLSKSQLNQLNNL